MDRTFGLDSLMASNGILDAQTYDAYWQRVMTIVENQELDLDGAIWDVPQIKFTYEMLEAQEQVSAMATYVSISSDPIPVGNIAPMRKLTGSIPRSKVIVHYTEEDMRNETADLLNIVGVANYSNIPSSQAVRDYVKTAIFKKQLEIPVRHRNSINYANGQVKSTGGLILTDKNNPNGLQKVTYDMGVPAANFIEATFFNRAADGTMTPVADADPVKTIRDAIREYKWKNGGAVVLEWNEKYGYYLLRHPGVGKYLGYEIMNILRLAANDDKQAALVADAANDAVLAEAFRRVVGADRIHVNKAIVGVDKWDKTAKKFVTEQLDTFDFGTILLRPEGNVVKIKNVVPMRPDGQAIVAGIFGNHGIVEYMYDRDQRIQTWKSELTAIPVLTRPKDMKYFKTVKDA